MGKRWQQRIVYDQHIEPGMAPSPPPRRRPSVPRADFWCAQQTF